MKTEDFISTLKEVVHDSSIQGVVSQLLKPSGRAPSPNLRAASVWYNRLSDTEKEMVKKVISLSVHSALFGVLTVIDGVCKIEDENNKGHLVLMHKSAHGEFKLNDPDSEMLHDLYQALTYDEVFGSRNGV